MSGIPWFQKIKGAEKEDHVAEGIQRKRIKNMSQVSGVICVLVMGVIINANLQGGGGSEHLRTLSRKKTHNQEKSRVLTNGGKLRG